MSSIITQPKSGAHDTDMTQTQGCSRAVFSFHKARGSRCFPLLEVFPEKPATACGGLQENVGQKDYWQFFGDSRCGVFALVSAIKCRLQMGESRDRGINRPRGTTREYSNGIAI